MKKRVFVGMSGGVDSSLTASLLLEQGYQVTGVYMKNWTSDVAGYYCPWEDDFNDAKRVASDLGIDFLVFDFQKEYKDKVVDYLLDGYKRGITPNPDVMCNQEIKFKLFFDQAIKQGADYIATGHYARLQTENGKFYLKTAQDQNKDQTYFLYRMSYEALSKSLMPIGDMLKSQVRLLAKKRQIWTANKKDSQGICFVGKIPIKQFLLEQLGPQSPGLIKDDHQKVVGQHDGAIFYTIGQRHGLNLGGGLPYYVYAKDMKDNTVYVTRDLDFANLWSDQLILDDIYFLTDQFKTITELDRVRAKPRYRAPNTEVLFLKPIDSKNWILSLKDQIKAPTPGQSVVFYNGDKVLGGGIINRIMVKNDKIKL